MTEEENTKPVESSRALEANQEIVLKADQVANAVLSRLIREIQCDMGTNSVGYNRTHNRHNRSS